MNPISHPLHWKLQKNRHVLESLLLGNAPAFVSGRSPRAIRGEVPVFTFHTAEPVSFERQCRHLVENGYHTLDADEFAHWIASGQAPPENAVVLTFDDGLAEVWTVAFPLLRKYGLHAICFLIPGVIPDDASPPRPNLADVWDGRAEHDDVVRPHRGADALCSWNEIRAMHETGVVQFESHTLAHGVVPVSDRVFDFFGPHYDPYFYANIHVPVMREDGVDRIDRAPRPGTPIFWSRPRMSAERRFFDDERVRQRCVERVAREGGDAFFERDDWRRELDHELARARRDLGTKGRFETEAERDAAILDDLGRCRELIEARLPGREVRQICWPWYEAGEFAVEQARRAGYGITYFGQLRGRPSNRPGDDPFHVVRVEEMFLERLPGHGRRGLAGILAESYLKRAPKPRPAFEAGPPAGHRATPAER